MLTTGRMGVCCGGESNKWKYDARSTGRAVVRFCGPSNCGSAGREVPLVPASGTGGIVGATDLLGGCGAKVLGPDERPRTLHYHLCKYPMRWALCMARGRSARRPDSTATSGAVSAPQDAQPGEADAVTPLPQELQPEHAEQPAAPQPVAQGALQPLTHDEQVEGTMYA